MRNAHCILRIANWIRAASGCSMNANLRTKSAWYAAVSARRTVVLSYSPAFLNFRAWKLVVTRFFFGFSGDFCTFSYWKNFDLGSRLNWPVNRHFLFFQFSHHSAAPIHIRPVCILGQKTSGEPLCTWNGDSLELRLITGLRSKPLIEDFYSVENSTRTYWTQSEKPSDLAALEPVC